MTVFLGLVLGLIAGYIATLIVKARDEGVVMDMTVLWAVRPASQASAITSLREPKETEPIPADAGRG